MIRVALLSLALCAALSLGAAAQAPDREARSQGGDHAEAAAAYASQQMRSSGAPGFAIGIVQGPHVLFARGYGRAGSDGAAVTVDTPFILGSTSKSFTALCVMQLVDAGRIDLDQPVERYLPGFLRGEGRSITIRMLLNQTSGINHAAGDQPILSPGPSGESAIRDWAMALTPEALNRAAGAGYEYSNANFVVLGAVVEAVSGETYPAYLRAHVFEPLGMRHSYASLDQAHGLAQGHREWFGWFEPSDVPYPASFVPAGFIISTVSDMTRYLSMQANGGELDGVRVVSAASLDLMQRGGAPMDQVGKSHYAMGWVSDTFNGVPVAYHDGDTGRFSSIIAISREDRYGVVVMANASGWLYGPHLTDAASGAINTLVGNTPRNYASPYAITKVILALFVLVALLQLVFAVRAFVSRRRRPLMWGRVAPTVLNLGLAAVFAYAVPRMLFGIPLTELLSSLPVMGVVAVASVACALAWLLLTAKQLIPKPAAAQT